MQWCEAIYCQIASIAGSYAKHDPITPHLSPKTKLLQFPNQELWARNGTVAVDGHDSQKIRSLANSASHHNRTTKVSHSTMKHPAGFKFSSEFTLVVSSGRFFWRHSSMKSSKLRWHRFTSAMKSLKLASWSIDAVLLGKWSCLFCAINERHASTLHCCFMGACNEPRKASDESSSFFEPNLIGLQMFLFKWFSCDHDKYSNMFITYFLTFSTSNHIFIFQRPIMKSKRISPKKNQNNPPTHQLFSLFVQLQRTHPQ